ncbi:hypothetical protein SYNPS1DRAFT_7533, partial [Syncephalis pseudoplumigaleata]
MRVRKVPMIRHPYVLADLSLAKQSADDEEEENEEENEEDRMAELRRLVAKDRDLYERGIRAFVSYVRSYTKHEATYIFRIKDLNLCQVAMSYALLKMPKMPELKDKDTSEFVAFDVNVDAIPFADK